jgi:hypothetical protein
LFIALLLSLATPMATAWAGQQTLITINDPAGDDYGAGTLNYPQRSDFQTGDLDLLQMKISRDEGGFWFEAMFRNPIRDPSGVANAIGNESLADFARKGFYQFNIDVYIDTDRATGSGNGFALPGRHVSIDPAYAWEKAVILTPRPELMRQQLLDALSEQFPGRPKTETEATVDQLLFFPTRIRVRGKLIAFFVPADFFAGSDGTDWAATALVTGAITNISSDLSFFHSAKKQLDRLQLGVMQPAAGHHGNTFGYSGAIPSPVVDLLSSSAEQQARQLAAMNNLTGTSWGPHAVNDAPAAATGVPAADAKPDGVTTPTPRAFFADLFQREDPAAGRFPDAKSAGESPLADPSIVRRLQTLQQLYDKKLIDETEYKEQKRRILKDL